jgi:hypothetical protein
LAAIAVSAAINLTGGAFWRPNGSSPLIIRHVAMIRGRCGRTCAGHAPLWVGRSFLNRLWKGG